MGAERASNSNEVVAALEQGGVPSADAAAFLDSVLRAAPLFIVLLDANLDIRYINRYQPGLGPEQVIGQSVFGFLDIRDHARARTVFEHVRDSGEPGSFETGGVGAHGAVARYVTHATAVRDTHGEQGVCVVVQDVTADRAREQALHDSEERLRVALEATDVGLWSWDARSGEISWDEVTRRIHGRDAPPTLQAYLDEIVHPYDRALIASRIGGRVQDSSTDSAEFRILRPDGEKRWLLTTRKVSRDARGEVIKSVGAMLDVTENHQLKNLLEQAQKMEAIGGLTAGIAHNFNNMLTVVMPALEVASSESSRCAPILREAQHAARRASELVRQLMTFAGQADCDEPTHHRIDELVDAVVAMCRRAFDRRIDLAVYYDDEPATVLCHGGQIEQALMNLLLNARDAVLEAGLPRRHITVRVSTCSGGLPSASPSDPDAAQATVRIEVKDDGTGMSEEVRRRAFEPFFTTKDTGRGTGLGLATSFAIASQHHGALSCESVPGVGTKMIMLLPVAASVRALDTESVAASAPHEHGIRVMVVDDEAAVRNTVSYLLAGEGMDVCAANSGALALEMLERDDALDVILLDRSMPEAPGEAFVSGIRARSPHTRILYFSGQTVDPKLMAKVDGIVPKPVTGPELLLAIRQAVAQVRHTA